MAHGDAWGGSWNGFWGDSWGAVDGGGVTPPPTPEPTPTPTEPGGVGGRQRFPGAWIRPKRKANLPKKKKSLIDELDDMIVELQSRVEEAQPEIDTGAYDRALRVGKALAERSDIGRISNRALAEEIAKLQFAMQELEDEEIILLMLH